MHKIDDPNIPPPHVLHALRRPRQHRLTEPETGPTPLQKALANAEVMPKGHHMPPRSVLGALHWSVVRRPRERLMSPIGLYRAAQRAWEQRARRVIVRRGRLVFALLPEELGPDDEVLADDDPYFRKKGRPRAVVEAWRGKPPERTA